MHNIRSLHNVGSIFRTADAAGAKKIYLCGITPAPVDRFEKIIPQFAKVSLGAEKYLGWKKFPSTLPLIKKLKDRGYKIFAIEQSKKSTPYFREARRAKGTAKIVLVLGNEVRGLPPAVLKSADKILEIPMLGGKESLNVAVAFGIVAFGFLSRISK